MAITGISMNFTKQVTNEERTQTAETPTGGGGGLSTKIAGESTDLQGIKAGVILGEVENVAETAINAALSSVENSQAQVQINALKKGIASVGSTARAIAINPVLGGIKLTTQVISVAAEQERQDRKKTWSDYDLSEYNRMRGYTAAYNRSRSN